MEALTSAFEWAQQHLFEWGVQPLMFALGMGDLLEDGYAATGWLLVGVLQLFVLVLLIGPLQRWRPVQAVTDVQAVQVDVLYTLVHRLGLFRLVLFFTLEPAWNTLVGELHMRGVGSFQLDQVWPGVSDVAWVSFVLYLLVFDFVDYWLHRAQHRFEWWWALHALHHSQRSMTMWTDNRNHLLSDLLRALVFAGVAQSIGVAPGQFVTLVALTQLVESLQHANLRLHFGAVGERLCISPRFHRLHHSIGLGHESAGRHSLGGCNFGVLFPWWDMLFGTADFSAHAGDSGVRDQVEPDAQGRLRHYGRGFWEQQWLGVLRLLRRA